MCQSLSNASHSKQKMSISDVIFDVLYVFETRHFLNMKDFQTQALTTMFCAQRSVNLINIFY